MVAFLLIAAIIGTVGAIQVFEAWVLATIWLWFAVPLGLPMISGAHAFGLSILIGLMAIPTPKIEDLKTKKDKGAEKDTWAAMEKLGATVLLALVRCIVALGLAYICKRLM